MRWSINFITPRACGLVVKTRGTIPRGRGFESRQILQILCESLLFKNHSDPLRGNFTVDTSISDRRDKSSPFFFHICIWIFGVVLREMSGFTDQNTDVFAVVLVHSCNMAHFRVFWLCMMQLQLFYDFSRFKMWHFYCVVKGKCTYFTWLDNCLKILFLVFLHPKRTPKKVRL